MSKKFVNLKIDIEADPDNLAAYKKYSRSPGVPAVAFVDFEGNLISEPPINLAFDPEKFVLEMEKTLEVEEDLKRLNAKLGENPNDPEANAQIALIYLKRNNLEKGSPLADKAFNLDPENRTGHLPELHISLGLYYGNHIDDENAEEYFQKAESHFKAVIEQYSDSKDHEPAHYYLAVIYVAQEMYDQAIPLLEKLSDTSDADTRTAAMQMLQIAREEANTRK
ncbi:MAG: tetratricopeptide repeat protein [Candidatus Poribacteria bacterium]|nr:tetratricopeptide repeat protein [Candidatus Poribacteria bacterium]MDE0506289.1 tetratricopeptide repeat protein [Candidatus Poribacteria bacterium]